MLFHAYCFSGACERILSHAAHLTSAVNIRLAAVYEVAGVAGDLQDTGKDCRCRTVLVALVAFLQLVHMLP